MFTGAPLIAKVPEDVIVADESPVALIDPELGAKVRAPVVKVNPLEAVRVWVEVSDPVLVVVSPVLPRVNAPVFVDVPIETPPLVLPLPASIETDPPVVDPVPLSVPAVRVRLPPVPPAVLLVAGEMVKLDPPASVVISAAAPPLSETTPNSETVSSGVPPDWILSAVPPVPALVSLITKALAEPALVNVKDVGVPRLPAKVKAMFLPVVVVMVLPSP